MAPDSAKDQDIAVLREMVRLAENRRSEEISHIERMNRYNLALIAFSASFLSLLITTDVELIIVQSAGFCLIVSIFLSLFGLNPTPVKGSTIVVDEDVQMVREGKKLPLEHYLLDTADLSEKAATNLTKLGDRKKKLMIFSTIFLAIALVTTYILYAYA